MHKPPQASPPSLPGTARASLLFAGVFARELLRRRVLWVACVVVACGLAMAGLSGQGAVHDHGRIVSDFVLAAMRLSGCAVAVAATVGGLAADETQRLGYTWLSRPVPRASWLFGRFLGLWAVLAGLIAVMAAAGALTVCAFAQTLPPPGYWAAAAMTLIELAVLQACALLFACLCAPPLAAAAAVVTLAAGSLAPDLAHLAEANPATAWLLGPLVQLLPDFHRLSMRPWAALGQAPPLACWAWALAYGLAYAACALLLAGQAYGRRPSL